MDTSQNRADAESLSDGRSVIPGAAYAARNDAESGHGKGVLSDGFLELLGCTEGDLLAGLDVDRFAGGGVAAHAGGALAHLKDAEAHHADAIALLQMLGDAVHQIGQNGF